MPSVLQPWLSTIPMMQQTVLLTAIRGPDGLPKYGAIKLLLRWYRRCILLSAMDGKVLDNPYEPNGGSFTGPSFDGIQLTLQDRSQPGPWPDWMRELPMQRSWLVIMYEVVSDYIRDLDAIPHHFQMHLMHAIEILGYKHPDPVIKGWWNKVYNRLVNDLHLHPETEEELDKRLGDDRAGWLQRADPATT